MYFLILVAIGWMYVTVMMAVAEATSSTGTVLGAIVTFVFYGLLPLGIVLYLLNTPARRRALRAAQHLKATDAAAGSAPGPVDPDQRGHAPGEPVAPERKEP